MLAGQAHSDNAGILIEQGCSSPVRRSFRIGTAQGVRVAPVLMSLLHADSAAPYSCAVTEAVVGMLNYPIADLQAADNFDVKI